MLQARAVYPYGHAGRYTHFCASFSFCTDEKFADACGSFPLLVILCFKVGSHIVVSTALLSIHLSWATTNLLREQRIKNSKNCIHCGGCSLFVAFRQERVLSRHHEHKVRDRICVLFVYAFLLSASFVSASLRNTFLLMRRPPTVYSPFFLLTQHIATLQTKLIHPSHTNNPRHIRNVNSSTRTTRNSHSHRLLPSTLEMLI